MSYDLVELIKEMDFKDTGLQIGLQCAPVIAGIKAANLFTIATEKSEEMKKALENTEISCILLYKGGGRSVFLIYEETKLQSYLRSEKVERILREFGYTDGRLEAIIPLFTARYRAYMEKRGKFPHELGFLLEYPIEDVMGFIKHQGKKFLYSGYWKVYEGKDEKISLFHRYEEVQKEIIKRFLGGSEIHEIIAFYRVLNQCSIEEIKKVQVA